MMFDSLNQTTDAEKILLRKLRVWIGSLAAVCILAGIGIGAVLAGRTAVAQDGLQSASRAPEALSASFVEIAQRVEPAVVNIDTTQAADTESENEDKTDRTPNPLYDMLRRQPPRPTHGVGSGFIIDPKGYILTNFHVIDGASRITIGTLNGERFRARVIGVDKEPDLAVLNIDSDHELPVMKFGDSNAAQVGDWVLAIGSPFGLDQTVTAGIISKKDRDTTSSSFQRFLQTDAAINRGNSGGPLVNMHGEAIGVNSQIATLTGDYNGIGFALPSNEAKFVTEQILSQGKVRRGFLGVTLESMLADRAESISRDNDITPREKSDKDKSNSARLGLTLSELTPQIIEDKHLNGIKGLYIKDVDPNGLAADVRPNEVQAGEVITRINRVPVATLADFQHVIESLKPGDAIVLNLSTYYRPQNRITSRIVQFTYQ